MAITEDHIREELKKVIDPELFVNIVDLGLIYLIDLKEADEGKFDVSIDMTMTRIIVPGTMEVCGLVISAARASPSMEPRSACGGWLPRPRKERPAVSRIIQPTVVDMAMTMTGITLGSTSDQMMRP